MRRVSTERRWTNQRVAHEVDRDRAWSIGRAIGALMIVAAPFTAYGYFKNDNIRLSYESKRLESERDELVERERRLTVRQVRLERLREVEAWAAERGLAAPSERQVVVVSQIAGVAPDTVGR